jgi:hypothetical protein
VGCEGWPWGTEAISWHPSDFLDNYALLISDRPEITSRFIVWSHDIWQTLWCMGGARRVHCELTFRFFFFLNITLLDVTMDGYYSSELLSQSNRPIRLKSSWIRRRLVWAIRLYGVTYQNIVISISTATGTSHLIIGLYLSSLGFFHPVIQISILGLVAWLRILFKSVFWEVSHQKEPG